MTVLEAKAAPGMIAKRFPALGHRNFRRYAWGQAFSMGGTWLQSVALAWLVLELTNSGVIVGIVAAAQFVPPLVLSAFAGTIADRFDARRAVLWLQVILGLQATSLAVLVFTDLAKVWSLIALTFLQGIAWAFDPPVRQSLMNDLVGDDIFANAIATNSALAHLGSIVGPMIAALLISTVGTPWCFAVNALSYVGMFFAIKSIRPEEMTHREKITDASGSLMAGFSYLRSRPDVVLLLGALCISMLFAGRLEVLIPLLAKGELRGGEQLFSNMNVARGLGSLCASLYVASRPTPPTITALRSGCICLVVALAIAAIPIEPLGLRQVVVLVCLVFAGIGTMFAIVTTLSMSQLLVSPSMRGRTAGVWFLCMNAGTVVGSPLVGWISDNYGNSTSLLLGAFSMLIVFAITGPAAKASQAKAADVPRFG
jgi:MFS family permease